MDRRRAARWRRLPPRRQRVHARQPDRRRGRRGAAVRARRDGRVALRQPGARHDPDRPEPPAPASKCPPGLRPPPSTRRGDRGRARGVRQGQDRRRGPGRQGPRRDPLRPELGARIRGRPGRARAPRVRRQATGRRRNGSDLLAGRGGGPVSTTRVNDNLIQVNRWRFVNAFLVREDDGFTVVDTAVGGSTDELIGAARSAGGEIRRIALTHGHGDHVGSLDALKERLGGGGEGGKPPGSWPKLKTLPDVTLTGGERIGSLEVVPTPGHTPGHVSFLDTRDRTIIAGDTYTSSGGLAVSNHFHLRFPLAAMATWDKTKALESARRLRALDPALVVVGHGGPVRAPGPAMDKAIASAGG